MTSNKRIEKLEEYASALELRIMALELAVQTGCKETSQAYHDFSKGLVPETSEETKAI